MTFLNIRLKTNPPSHPKAGGWPAHLQIEEGNHTNFVNAKGGLTVEDLYIISEVIVATQLNECEWCGTLFSERHRRGLSALHAHHPEWCFTCEFWHKHLDYHMDSVLSVVIDGVAYSIAPEARKGLRGFDGAKFQIRFHSRVQQHKARMLIHAADMELGAKTLINLDETTLTTTNLWCSGAIPPKFRNLMPDNAVFISAHTYPTVKDI